MSHGGDASAYGSFAGTNTASHTGGDPNAQAHLNPQHTDAAFTNAYSPQQPSPYTQPQQQGVMSSDAITPMPTSTPGPSVPPPAYDQNANTYAGAPTMPDKGAQPPPQQSGMNQPQHPAPVAQKPQPHPPMAPINGSNGGTVTPLHLLHGLQPYWIDCPYCKHRTMTRAAKEGSSMQYVASALLCLICICCVCVPQLAGWFENVNYYCTNCHKLVAMQPHDGPIQVYAPPEMGAVPSQYGSAPGQAQYGNGSGIPLQQQPQHQHQQAQPQPQQPQSK